MDFANFSVSNFSVFLPKSKFDVRPGKMWDLMTVILGGDHLAGKCSVYSVYGEKRNAMSSSKTSSLSVFILWGFIIDIKIIKVLQLLTMKVSSDLKAKVIKFVNA